MKRPRVSENPGHCATRDMGHTHTLPNIQFTNPAQEVLGLPKTLSATQINPPHAAECARIQKTLNAALTEVLRTGNNLRVFGSGEVDTRLHTCT